MPRDIAYTAMSRLAAGVGIISLGFTVGTTDVGGITDIMARVLASALGSVAEQERLGSSET